MAKLTRQEIFNRAYLGLKSQGFRRCINQITGQCLYSDGAGNHCAWGWVDTDLSPEVYGSVQYLRSQGKGLAADLDVGDIDFALALQATHDEHMGDMKTRLWAFADNHGLTVPGEDPGSPDQTQV